MIDRTEKDIIATWGKNVDINNPVVTIKCLTFNHKDFISTALDGMLMQITNFPFEIVVHDDASTDGTIQILQEYEKKYPNLIHVIYEEENQYSKKIDFNKKINDLMKGKYIANCEGDDYWIDEHKLQKQMDYMQDNPDVIMCFTNFNRWFQRTQVMQYSLLTTNPQQFKSEFTLKEWILEKPYIAPMTWFVKREAWDSFYSQKPMDTVDESFVMVTHYLHLGKVACLKDETTAVYRSLVESVSHTVDSKKMYQRMENLHQVQLLLIDRYNVGADFKQIVEDNYYSATYKLILLAGPKNEREKCKAYCKSLKGKALYLLTSVNVTRGIINWLWKKRLSYSERKMRA